MNRIGYGAMQLAGPNVWGPPSDPESARRVLRLAVALGVTYLRLPGDTPGAESAVPLEDSLGALVELREQGLIRRIGLSGASPRMLARARAMTPIAAVQNRFNLLDRSGVQVLADCEEQGIMFVPYFPLASGRLAGYDQLTGPAQRLGVTPAQVALAWLLRRSPAVVVIPGTSNPGHLRANIAAAEVAGDLTDDEVTRLTSLVDEPEASLGQSHQSTIDAQKASADSRR